MIAHVVCYLEFLGANELDDRPFVVMPYMKNGNARDYVQRHPNCDRLKIVWISRFILLLFSDESNTDTSYLARSRLPAFEENRSWRPQSRNYHLFINYLYCID
jgi:hypothetical protein